MMYIYREDAERLLRDAKSGLLDGLDSRFDLLKKLLREDDWSFVIKSHALIESVVTESIVNRVDESSLQSVVRRIPLSDSQYGKLTIAKELNLLTQGQRSFIRFLSQLRNELVHKVENIEFEFIPYIEAMNKSQRKTWRSAITWFEPESSYWLSASVEQPKIAVWMSVFLIATLSFVEDSERHGKRELDRLAQQTSEDLLRQPNSE
nr:hypothetical protein BN993_04246 [Virgibacillus halodenitrificans]